MPRRRIVAKRKMLGDLIYGDPLVERLIKKFMRNGNKILACKIVYGAFEEIEAQEASKKMLEDRTTSSEIKPSEEIAQGAEKESTQSVALRIFKKCIQNVKPEVEVRSKAIGGGTVQIPSLIPPERGEQLALDFIRLEALARKRTVRFGPGNKMIIRKLLALEIMDAAENKGGAIKRRQDMHRMAKANQAHVHLRLGPK